MEVTYKLSCQPISPLSPTPNERIQKQVICFKKLQSES